MIDSLLSFSYLSLNGFFISNSVINILFHSVFLILATLYYHIPTVSIDFVHVDPSESIENLINHKLESLLHKYDKHILSVKWHCSKSHLTFESKVDLHTLSKHFNADSKDQDLHKTLDIMIGKLEHILEKEKDKTAHKHQKKLT